MKTNPNDKYPNISKFMPELNIGRRNELSVNASDLEAFLAKGVVVYGQENSFKAHSKQDHTNLLDVKVPCDTHSGLLLSYQPIESNEPVNKDELLNLLVEIRANIEARCLGDANSATDKLISRIKRNGVGK